MSDRPKPSQADVDFVRAALGLGTLDVEGLLEAAYKVAQQPEDGSLSEVLAAGALDRLPGRAGHQRAEGPSQEAVTRVGPRPEGGGDLDATLVDAEPPLPAVGPTARDQGIPQTPKATAPDQVEAPAPGSSEPPPGGLAVARGSTTRKLQPPPERDAPISEPNSYGPFSSWKEYESAEQRQDPAIELLRMRFAEDEGRHEVGDEIGRGGMGKVCLATDRNLQRRVAVKTLHEHVQLDSSWNAKLIREAQATGQLEHPNIIPIYHLGAMPAGEVFYTMKRVQGRSLAKVLAGLRRKDEETVGEFTRVRLLSMFQQVAMAMGYAHSKGVIHRDLKPHNIMLGDFGEVMVMDWGIALVRGDDVRLHEALQPFAEAEEGQVLGTPMYMAPEQALGSLDGIDHRADIYSLGAILYELLTLCQPYVGANSFDILAQVLSRAPELPSVRTPDRAVPPELEEICMTAMSRKKEDRYASARQIYEDVEEFLEGTKERERRRREAAVKVSQGRKYVSRYYSLTRSLEKKKTQAREARARLVPWESLTKKAGVWATEAHVTVSELELAETFGEAVRAFTQALGVDPDCVEAREGLAALYLDRFERAGRERDRPEMVYYESLIRLYDTGRMSRYLDGEGILELATEPPGAALDLYEVRRRRRVITPVEKAISLGTSPAVTSDLPTGTYVVRATAPGFREISFPVSVERQGICSVSVRLYTDEQIGEGFRYVPGGPFTGGGDRAMPDAGHTTTYTTPDLAVAEVPVTAAEYLEFINELASRSPMEAAVRQPRFGAFPRWARVPGGGFRLPTKDPEGVPIKPDAPVFGVSWEDALAYCSWRGERDGREYRLPTESEWEKAARGVDRRTFPWGDHFEANFCNMRDSFPTGPAPATVGSFEQDISPYGVRDLAGGTREWCLGPEQSGMRPLRGGAWDDGPMECRVTFRFLFRPAMPHPRGGFRIVHQLSR